MASDSSNGSIGSLAVENANIPGRAEEQKAHEEYQYLKLIRQILAEGEHRPDR